MTTMTTHPITAPRRWAPRRPVRPVPVSVLVWHALVAPWSRRPRPSASPLRVAVAVIAVPVTALWWVVVGLLSVVAFLGTLVGAAFLGLTSDGG